MARLKSEVAQVNISTVCDKRELVLNVDGPKLNYRRVAHMLVADTARALVRRLTVPLRKTKPAYAPRNP